MPVLATIGYEGSTLDEFIACLRGAGVARILDIRDAPISRKPGFSIRELAYELSEAGIAYVHFKGLGNPKPGRDAARAGNSVLYRHIFGEQLETEAAILDLGQVHQFTQDGLSCLMCFERDPARCHRSMVIDALRERWPFETRHLFVVTEAERRQPSLPGL